MFGTYRGRLVFPFTADLRRLDTAGTAAAKDGGGYDDDFHEPSPYPAVDGQGPGTTTRAEFDSLLLPCQVELGSNEKIRQFFQGNNPTTQLVLVFHFRDLESAGLVDESGNALLRVGDRLERILQARTGAVAWTPIDQVFATEIQPNSFGLGQSRNLLFVYFNSRDRAV